MGQVVVNPYGHEFDPDEFPHGLRCIDCEREITVGDRWASRLEALDEWDGEPVSITEILCLECALLVPQ